MDILVYQGLQVGDVVNVFGEILLVDDQNSQDGGDGLGDDGEVNVVYVLFEYGYVNNEGQQDWYCDYCDQGE